MPLDKATYKIHHAIEQKLPFYAFPKPAYWAIKCLSILPLKLQDWLIAKQKYKKKSYKSSNQVLEKNWIKSSCNER